MIRIVLAAIAIVLATLSAQAVECIDPLKLIPKGCTPRDGGGGSGGLETLWTKLQSAKREDLVYAKALADGANTDGGRMRAKCWGAWVELIDKEQGTNAKDANGNPLGPMPDPHIFSRFEQIAQIADALQPTSPFVSACGPVKDALKMTLLQFVTAAVSGAASLGALGIP